MKNELIKILQKQDLLDNKTYKQQADEILNLFDVRLSLIDRKVIFDKTKEHEEYHHKGMIKGHGDLIPIKDAVMYCGNSFDDGVRWYKEKLNEA